MSPNVLTVLLSIALSSFIVQTSAVAIDLKPLHDPSDLISKQASKRDGLEPLRLVPVEDLEVLTHGRSSKRDTSSNDVFNPKSQNSFYWGAYAGNAIYMANFTLMNPDEDEFILPIEDFAKRLKAIQCGSTTTSMTIEFVDRSSFDYAKTAWDWVNKEEDNKFTLVTKPDQCYEGDDRSPYLVHDITFDSSNLLAKLNAKERSWGEIAHSFRLQLSHELVDPTTVNLTHPHLIPRASKTMDISHSFDQNLFHFTKDETNGMDLTADAQINTAGQIIADLDVEYKWFIPTDIQINIHPAGVHADFLLSAKADGQLGNGIDWTLKPNIEIPVAALNIKGILEIGPFVTLGVHVGSTALQGSASFSAGARATIDDSARVDVKLRHPESNSISGWTPQFEKIDPAFSASIGGNLRAWAELGIQLKAEVLGRWGYQASLDAQLPYFEAAFAAKADSGGVCDTEKVLGIDFDADVGINVNLNAGEIDKAPSFQKDLFSTEWPLYSTCIAFGGNAAQASTSAHVAMATVTSDLPLPTDPAAFQSFIATSSWAVPTNHTMTTVPRSGSTASSLI
ncbi:hypothetical protein EJ04DRAFT_561229 [Polyplosphaeria fusca]|uniref:Uncharacterized protein n=1 Tax=Polyplosphaeria fusca TaxID=682080 RepID=A0A9P4V4J1_9PLEO|nr:hypothetical protein EJ04DRAFT_561229 [Polyplosphaeria fusca]